MKVNVNKRIAGGYFSRVYSLNDGNVAVYTNCVYKEIPCFLKHNPLLPSIIWEGIVGVSNGNSKYGHLTQRTRMGNYEGVYVMPYYDKYISKNASPASRLFVRQLYKFQEEFRLSCFRSRYKVPTRDILTKLRNEFIWGCTSETKLAHVEQVKYRQNIEHFNEYLAFALAYDKPKLEVTRCNLALNSMGDVILLDIFAQHDKIY